MSAPAQDGQAPAQTSNPLRQRMHELRQNQKYKTLILPEQVTLQYFPFLAEATMKQYQTGMSNLWQAIATKAEDDPQHQQALAKCQQFSQNLIKQLNSHRQTQGAQQSNGQAATSQQVTASSQVNQAAQARAPSQPPQQQQQATNQQASQNQPQNASQPTQDQNQSSVPQSIPQQLQTMDQQSELPADLKQRVESMHFEAPNNLQGNAAAEWRAEAQKRYSRALQDQYQAQMKISRAEQIIRSAKSKGQEIPANVLEIKGEEEKKSRASQQLIDSLTRGQNANNAPAAQAAARVIQQTNAQIQSQNGENMQNRPSSQGQTAMNPAIAAAQQQQMRTSMTPPVQSQQQPQQMGVNAHQNNGFAHPQQPFNLQRPQPNPTQATQMKYPTPPTSLAPGSLTNQSPVPLTHQAAVAAAARSHSQATPGGIPQLTSQGSFTQNMNDKTTNKYPSSFNKNWTPQTPQPANMQATARPTLTGLNSGPMGVMGQPAIQKQPPFLLQGQGDRVLDKKKLDELVRQVTGGSGEGLQPEVEEVRTRIST